MASHKFGPQFEKKRWQFEFSGDNDKQYRDNWDRIFAKKDEHGLTEEDRKELDEILAQANATTELPPVGTQLELPFSGPKCAGCGNEIDPEMCGCGDSMDHGFDGSHYAIPMGCDCYRAH